MENDLDIECKGNVSEILLYQLKEFLIPAISANIKKYHPISINASAININYESKAVGAGLSCGVDSLYTVFKHAKYTKESGLRVTHAAFFNAGASGEYGGEEARTKFMARKKIFEEASKELDLEFIAVDSNMNEFLKQNHQATHTFRTLSIPLALQKLFRRYYFSSGYVYSDFKFDAKASAYYDILSTNLLSTNNLKIESVGGECARLEKVEFIAEEESAQKYLNVCIPEVTNCSKCHKCRRTILELYAINKLDNFSEVFDLKYFYENKNKYMVLAVQTRYEDHDVLELYKVLRKQKKIKLWHIVFGNVRKVLSLGKRTLKRIYKVMVK